METNGAIQDMTQVLVQSFVDVWTTFMNFLPALVAAVIFLIVGLIIASGLQAIVERVVRASRVDSFLRRTGADVYVERAGMRLDVAKFSGGVAYWFVLIASFLAIANVLGLDAVADFINESVLGFIPHVVVAVAVMLVTVVIANFLQKAVRASAMSVRFHAGKFLGSMTWWIVMIFGTMEALTQLGIDIQIAWVLINTLVMGITAMVAIAGGIAFGLGGREYAARIFERIQKEFEK